MLQNDANLTLGVAIKLSSTWFSHKKTGNKFIAHKRIQFNMYRVK